MLRQGSIPGLERPKMPRAQPLKRMGLVDAGNLPGGAAGIRLECRHCNHDTGWIEDVWTVTQVKRGIPCPVCNSGQMTEGTE